MTIDCIRASTEHAVYHKKQAHLSFSVLCCGQSW